MQLWKHYDLKNHEFKPTQHHHHPAPPKKKKIEAD